MKNKIITALLLFAALGPMTAGVCHALFIPGGLNPGDTYRLMFVTERTIDATSADINVYNNFVQGQADASPLTTGTTWEALVSVAGGLNARENAGTQVLDGIDIFNLNDDLLANGTADLFDGSIAAPVRYDQNAVGLTDYIWIGSRADGSAWDTNGGRELGGASGEPMRGGSHLYTNTEWITEALAPAGALSPLYAMSPVLTVPGTTIPAPATIVLFGLGLTFLGITRRKRPPHR